MRASRIFMRSIATVLKRQKLRRAYPSGVHISNVIQRGVDTYYTRLTNLKNGCTFEVLNHTGYLAILSVTMHRDALIDGFRAAGIHVTEGFVATAETNLQTYEIVGKTSLNNRGWGG